MNDDLALKIAQELSSAERWMKGFICDIDGIKYILVEEKNSKWEDEGKCQYKFESGVICKTDDNYNILEKYDYGVCQSISRTRSYYSDYYYSFDRADAYRIVTTLIPEVIIPAHEEKKWKKIN